jgi:hypothetical protein
MRHPAKRLRPSAARTIYPHMMVMSKMKVIALLLLLVLPAKAQEKPTVVKLAVIHDGQGKPTPNKITLTFNNHSIQVTVRDGEFEVPSEIRNSEKFTLITDIGKDHIQLSGIPRVALQSQFWTLHLAEQRYSDDFQFAINKGTIVSKSCIMAFTSLHHEGWFMTARQCRSRNK